MLNRALLRHPEGTGAAGALEQSENMGWDGDAVLLGPESYELTDFCAQYKKDNGMSQTLSPLLKALVLHPTSVLIGKVLALFFVATVLVMSRLSEATVQQLKAKGWSQMAVILTGAGIAFILQAYAVIAEYYSRRYLPLKALDALCKEAYRPCCKPRAFDLDIRVTAFLPRLTWRGERLVSVSRFVHGHREQEASIDFKPGEGTVGEAYKLNQASTVEQLPDPNQDRNAYFEEVARRCNMDRKKLRKLHVCSRSFMSVPIRYFDQREIAAGVLSIDSISPDLIPQPRRTDVVQLADAAMILFHNIL